MDTLEVGNLRGYYYNNGTPYLRKGNGSLRHKSLHGKTVAWDIREFKPRYGAYIAGHCGLAADDDGNGVSITSYSSDHIIAFIRVISMHPAGMQGTAGLKHERHRLL